MPPRSVKQLGKLHLDILRIIKRPGGASIEDVRSELGLGETQAELGRRIRDLNPHHLINRSRKGRFTVYQWERERRAGEWDFSVISKPDRARVYHAAGGKCQMCGSSIAEDGVKLVIDHKIPQAWGGASNLENLWAICSVCNEGKQAFFATFDKDTMTQVLSHKRVHKRLLECLRIAKGGWVDTDLLGFVANFEDFQEDWQKRLRELRYFGIQCEMSREKQKRRTVAKYRLTHDVPDEDLPEDLSAAAREFERKRALRNKSGTS